MGEHPVMHVGDWALAFGFTLAVESPVYVLGTRRYFGLGVAGALALVLNLATHPAAWSLISLVCSCAWYGILAVEAAVVLVEALLLLTAARSRLARRPLPLSTCAAIAVVANGASAGLSLLIWG